MEVKLRRLQEVNATFREGLQQLSQAEVGRVHVVLVEGDAKRAGTGMAGRTDTGRRVIIPEAPVPAVYHANSEGTQRGSETLVQLCPGDYLAFLVCSCPSCLHHRIEKTHTDGSTTCWGNLVS
ncbi:hypothetical protein CYMTET_24950 [Cymbomonas tetramitiformis]|uniref:Uncharacterized protein n=1 Tax=Cymbomonas tetramitiformis TaxID=36881 RepID=A0AAE0FV38_9CHLO|nr:hypothetical protein CYMTET_24950 [Cymbomonas tetramitiformis]